MCGAGIELINAVNFSGYIYRCGGAVRINVISSIGAVIEDGGAEIDVGGDVACGRYAHAFGVVRVERREIVCHRSVANFASRVVSSNRRLSGVVARPVKADRCGVVTTNRKLV